MGDIFIFIMFMIFATLAFNSFTEYLTEEEKKRKQRMVRGDIRNLLSPPFQTKGGYIDYNYPSEMVVKEIILVITRSGNMKLKVSLNRKNEVFEEYIKRISLRAEINDYKDQEFETNNTYIINIAREDAKSLSESIIREYFRYKNKIYYQEVNIVGSLDGEGALDYAFIESESFYNRI